jgi:hypothetical protein
MHAHMLVRAYASMCAHASIKYAEHMHAYVLVCASTKRKRERERERERDMRVYASIKYAEPCGGKVSSYIWTPQTTHKTWKQTKEQRVDGQLVGKQKKEGGKRGRGLLALLQLDLSSSAVWTQSSMHV